MASSILGVEIVSNATKVLSDMDKIKRKGVEINNSSRKTASNNSSGSGSTGEINPDKSGGGSSDSALKQAFKSVGYASIAKSIVSGIGQVMDFQARMANRSGMFSQAISGNIIGSGTAALQRRADMKETGFGTASNVLMGAGTAAMLTGAGAPVGLGLMGLGAIVGGIGKITAGMDDIKIAKMETVDTLAQGWLGNYKGFQGAGNTLGGRSASEVQNYAKTGAIYGIASPEYASYMQQYAKMSGSDSLSRAAGSINFAALVADKTGADMGALMQLNGSFERYGKQGALTSAFNGNKSMGGNNATLEEYTRAMSKVFQNDLSKGIVRGNENVARSITGMSNYLFNASGGNNMAYRNSENIARINMGVSDAIAGATDVGNATQMMMMRNASSYYDKNREEVNARLRKAGINVDGMDRASIVMTMANDSSFANDLFGANTQYINSIYGKGSAHSVLAQQEATGQSWTVSAQSLQGNRTDLTAGIGNEAIIGRERNGSDEALAYQTAQQNRMIGTGELVLPEEMKNMIESTKLVNEQLTATLGKLQTTLEKND
ncbi:MAG: hypothetical protein Ta2A_11920 [Treponemataceae bacterium]|nr:MAG: hypothetical protein Ta2A_11920 [Treponemataceae bacterium]